VIKSFKDEDTERLFLNDRVKRWDLSTVARRKLVMIDAAGQLNDLKVPPGNRLHSLKHGCEGQNAIRVNDQYRICFTWRDGDDNAYDVEITDYH
jgi:proteic killer suppression protein